MDNHIWQAIFPNLSFSKAGDQKEIRQVFATAKQKKKDSVMYTVRHIRIFLLTVLDGSKGLRL